MAMQNYTDNERAYLERIRERLSQLRAYLNHADLEADAELDIWLAYLAGMKAIQGNFSNDLSLIATLMAKRYLAARFDIGSFDAAEKAQGASGLDIDFITVDGQHIIGEIKTTVPYSGARNDFGAQQKESFKRDFNKLNTAVADHKFMFLTDAATYDVLQKRYITQIPGVEIVLLTLT